MMQKLKVAQLVLFNMDKPNDIDWKSKRMKRNELKSYVRRFLLYPAFWEDVTKHFGMELKWKKRKFSATNAGEIPTSSGLYCFVVIPPVPDFFITRYLFYVGKASGTSFRSRYKNYIDEMNGIGIGEQKARIKVEEMLNDYYDDVYFFYVEINNPDLIKELEVKLLNTFFPYVNSHHPEATISEEYKHIY